MSSNSPARAQGERRHRPRPQTQDQEPPEVDPAVELRRCSGHYQHPVNRPRHPDPSNGRRPAATRHTRLPAQRSMAASAGDPSGSRAALRRPPGMPPPPTPASPTAGPSGTATDLPHSSTPTSTPSIPRKPDPAMLPRHATASTSDPRSGAGRSRPRRSPPGRRTGGSRARGARFPPAANNIHARACNG